MGAVVEETEVIEGKETTEETQKEETEEMEIGGMAIEETETEIEIETTGQVVQVGTTDQDQDLRLSKRKQMNMAGTGRTNCIIYKYRFLISDQSMRYCQGKQALQYLLA